jgi:hypothetical protein
MTGGLIQISTFGNQDIMLTGNPEITFFNVIYRRYTNFGVKFVETSFDNNIDFNKTSSLLIPKVVDFLSNIILKIKLPAINLNQQLISDDSTTNIEQITSYYNYLVYFKDRLTFVVNNFFNTNYSTQSYISELNKYILKHISFDQYLQYFYTVDYLYNIIDIDKSSSSYFRSSGSNFKSSSSYYKNCSLYALSEDTTYLIFTYINYSNSELPYSIFSNVIYENLKGIDEFNKIVYDSFINKSSNIETKKLGWIKKIGIYLFNSIDLYIGSNPINQLSPDYINIFGEVKYQNTELYNNIIGSNLDTPSQYKDEQYLYLPVPAWFTQNYGMAFPLISLQYNDMELRIKTKKIENCLTGDVDALYEDIINNYNNIFLSQLEITAIFEYVYLDNVERKKFAQSSHEYLITQVQYNYFNNFNNGSSNFNLDINFYHCAKDMFWFVKKDDKVVLGEDKSVYISNSSIILNGTDLINQEYKYFNYLHPYTHYKSTPSHGVNVYSFSLNPLETQPSGSCNFSRIPKTSLNVVLNKDITIENDSLNLTVIVVNYNILRIIGGISGLAYTY